MAEPGVRTVDGVVAKTGVFSLTADRTQILTNPVLISPRQSPPQTPVTIPTKPIMAIEGPAGPTGKTGGDGPPGPKGEPGPEGSARGYGYAIYGSAESWRQIVPGQIRSQLQFDIDSGSTVDALSNGLSGTQFWRNNRLYPVDSDGTAIVRIDFTAIPRMVDTKITIEIDIGGSFGSIQSASRITGCDGGSSEEISLSFPVYERMTFLQNGGAFFITCSAATVIQEMRLIVFPLSRP